MGTDTMRERLSEEEFKELELSDGTGASAVREIKQLRQLETIATRFAKHRRRGCCFGGYDSAFEAELIAWVYLFGEEPHGHNPIAD